MNAYALKRVVSWVLFNALIAALTVYGFALGVEGARYTATFFIVVMSLLSFAYFSKTVVDAAIKKGAPSVPSVVSKWFAICLICFLAWHGEFTLATLALFNMLNEAFIYKAIEDQA